MKDLHTNFLHFAPSVPCDTRQKMADLAQLVEDEVIGAQHDGYGCLRIDPISGNAYDGFIPHQEGGYSVSEMFGNGCGSGKYFTEGEREESNRMLEQCALDYASHEGIDREEVNFSSDEYGEYESEYMRDCDSLLTCEIWTGHRKDSQPGIVTVQLSVNYKDAPYFRSEYAEDILELQYTAEEFAAVDLSEIVKQLKAVL